MKRFLPVYVIFMTAVLLGQEYVFTQQRHMILHQDKQLEADKLQLNKDSDAMLHLEAVCARHLEAMR